MIIKLLALLWLFVASSTATPGRVVKNPLDPEARSIVCGFSSWCITNLECGGTQYCDTINHAALRRDHKDLHVRFLASETTFVPQESVARGFPSGRYSFGRLQHFPIHWESAANASAVNRAPMKLQA